MDAAFQAYVFAQGCTQTTKPRSSSTPTAAGSSHPPYPLRQLDLVDVDVVDVDVDGRRTAAVLTIRLLSMLARGAEGSTGLVLSRPLMW